MFLKSVNSYPVPNAGHSGTLNANTWYLVESDDGISNAMIILSNGITLAIVNNKIKVIYNYSTSDIQIQTYYNGENEFYLKSDTTVEYTWLGALDAPLENKNTTATNISTYKISANNGTNYNTATSICYGTSPTPPAGLPTGSLYIYYSGSTS